MPFQPGQSGNPKGRGKEKPFAEMLRIAIKDAYAEGGTKLRAVADALVAKAMDGDVPAIKEIADRLDGKVPQGIQGEPDGSPVELLHRIERIIVDPANPDS